MCDISTVYDETKTLEQNTTTTACPECEREHERLREIFIEQATARVQAEQTVAALKDEIERLRADLNRAVEQIVKRQPELLALRMEVETLKDMLANAANYMATYPGMEKTAADLHEFLESLEPRA